MKGILINQENILAAETLIPENTPFLMLNLLRFKKLADYGTGKGQQQLTGQEVYMQRYIPAFVELASPYKEIRPFWLGTALAGLVVSEHEKWDNIALIEYPSFQSFRDVAESESYKNNALPHRLAALEDWKLIITVKMDIG